LALFWGKPITKANSELLDPLHSASPCS
jgi:hypothetical protein